MVSDFLSNCISIDYAVLWKNLAVALENSSFLSWKVNSCLALFKNVLYSDLSVLLGIFFNC